MTMVPGNLVALQQHNIKRLLAYSSIGQVGYMLMGIVALSPAVTSALLLHMTGYVITNLAAFTAIIAYHNLTDAEEMHDFRGMSDRAPLLAAVLAVALFSLAGMPLFAGFLTKFIFFQSVADAGLLLAGGVAVVASFISLYYYLQVLREAYINPAEERSRLQVPLFTQGMVALLALGVFFVGLYPAPLFERDGQGREGAAFERFKRWQDVVVQTAVFMAIARVQGERAVGDSRLVAPDCGQCQRPRFAPVRVPVLSVVRPTRPRPRPTSAAAESPWKRGARAAASTERESPLRGRDKRNRRSSGTHRCRSRAASGRGRSRSP